MLRKNNKSPCSRQYFRRYGFSMCLLFLGAMTAVICCLLYRYDNKYTASGPKAAYGSMELTSAVLEEQGVVWLVDGWEFYGGVLLTPEEIMSGRYVPGRYIYAGQLGGFESVDGCPYGSASYRLTVKLSASPQTYALYLPEVFSSCRLYINGEEVLDLGQTSPENYTAGTAEKVIPFEASGQAELVLAVSNFSNMYGGLVYPPALGIPDAVYHMTTVRLNLRIVLLTLTFLTGMTALLIGIANRMNSLPCFYALFCVLFAGFTCYPAAKTLIPGFDGLYFLEHLSFCGMILIVFILQRKLFSLENPMNTFGVAFGGLVCVVCAVYHLFLPQASSVMMHSYSALITLYKWVSAVLLTANTFKVLKRTDGTSGHARLLLCGMVIFDCTLIMDRLLPLYEPIYSGWFIEFSSLCLVLLMGAVILREIYHSFVKSLVLAENLRLTNQNIAVQKEQHQAIMQAIARERTFRHDLRHHVLVLHELAAADDIDALKRYFSEIEQELPVQNAGVYCENTAVDAIMHYYEAQARVADVEFTAAIHLSEDLSVSDIDLSVIFGNCLENALEACRRQRNDKKYIRVNAGVAAGVLAITIENSFDGEVQHTSEGFVSRKRGQPGIGTTSIQTVSKKYNGRVEFSTENNVFQTTVFLHL